MKGSSSCSTPREQKNTRALREMLRPALSIAQRGPPDFGGKVDRIRKQFREIRETDFLTARKQDVEIVLRKLEGTQPSEASKARAARFPRQNLAHSPAPGDRSRRLGLADSKIHRSQGEISFRTDVLRIVACSRSTCLTPNSRTRRRLYFETLIRRFGIQDKAVAEDWGNDSRCRPR